MPPLSDPDELVLETLLTMVIADGDADPDELGVLARVYEELTERTIEAPELETRARARLKTSDPTALPPSLAERLEDNAKRRVLLAALAIAEADGFVLEEEDTQLSALVAMLGLPPQAYRDAAEGRLSVESG